MSAHPAMTTEQCHGLMARIDRVTTHDALHALCRETADAFYCHYFMLSGVMPTSLYNPEVYVVSGYPAEWWQRYQDAGHFQHDPLAWRTMQGATRPIIWHEMDLSSDPDPMAAQEIMREADAHGLRAGVSFPGTTRGGLHTTFSLASNYPAPPGHSLIRHILPQARLLSTSLCAALERVVTRQGGMVRLNHALTQRERDCLFWSANGCTSADIAAKTGASSATVTDHLRKATRKLGASNRTQAVARALMLGIIRPANTDCQSVEAPGATAEDGAR